MVAPFSGDAPQLMFLLADWLQSCAFSDAAQICLSFFFSGDFLGLHHGQLHADAAAAQVVRESAKYRSWLVSCETATTLASWLPLVIVTWFTSPLMLLPCLLLLYLAALLRMDKSPLLPLCHPILLLLPVRFSAFGLRNGQHSAFQFRVLSGILRGLALVALGTMPWWYPWAAYQDFMGFCEYGYGYGSVNGTQDCNGLPAWLQEDCNNDILRAADFLSCQEDSWLFAGSCRLWAASCRLSSNSYVDPMFALLCLVALVHHQPLEKLGFLGFTAAQHMREFYFEQVSEYSLEFAWYIVPCLSFLVSTILQLLPTKNLAQQLQACPVLQGDLPEASAWDRLKVHKLFCLLVVDFVSDLNCMGTFFGESTTSLVSLRSSYLWLSGMQQLRQSGPKVLWEEYQVSLSAGYPTDRFLAFSFTEKSVEAPLSLLLQFYTFPFVTGDLWAVYSFSFSMLLSLYTITDAAYVLIHLDMFDELVKLSLPESE